MLVRTLIAAAVAIVLAATQLSCVPFPGLRPTPTAAPLAPPHELLRVEQEDLAVTLTLAEGEGGREGIGWAVDAAGEGPGYEVAIHQAALSGGSRVTTWAEAEKASPSRTTSRATSVERRPGRVGKGWAMLMEVRPGERVAVFLELKVKLAGENGAISEIGTVRGPVLLEPAGTGWALVPQN